MASRKRRGRKRGPGIVANLRDPQKIRTLYIIVGLALVFGGSLGFGSANCGRIRQQFTGNRSQAPVKGSDPIAKIEDRVITNQDYQTNLENTRRRMESQQQDQAIIHPPEYDADMNFRVLQQMLDMDYFDIRGAQTGVTATPEQVNAKVEEYRKMLVPAQAQPEERSLLERLMESLSAVKKEQAFETQLKTIDPTMTLPKLRDLIAQELVAQAYVGRLQGDEQQKINDQLTSRMLTIRGEIEAGKEFAAAATQYSQDNTSSMGGLIPLIKHDSADLPKPIVDSAFSLPVGEISQPIIATDPEAKRGIWLITVVSRREASGAEWDAAKETLRQQLLEKKRQDVEAGRAQMPAEGNLTVSDDELKTDYEQASIRAIFLKGEDPMSRVQQAVEADIKSMHIEIYDPELRAMYHIQNEEWSLAAADYMEALQKNTANLDPDKGNQLAIDLEEANLRYLIANLWGTRAYRLEALWLQTKWQEYQANPDAFGGSFPDTPPEIRSEQQGYFVLALRNLEKSIELNSMSPWSHIQRAQIELARKQVTPTLVEDLSLSHEYSSNDFNLEQRVLQSIKQAISMDDKALLEAGAKRPDNFVAPVLPEDSLGLTLDGLDASYKALIGQWQTEHPVQGTMSAGSSDVISNAPSATGSEGMEGLLTQSTAETEPSAGAASAGGSAQDEVAPPQVPEAEPTGPLPQQVRDQLNLLQDTVQREVDTLTAQRQAAQSQQQAQDQRGQQLPVNPPQ